MTPIFSLSRPKAAMSTDPKSYSRNAMLLSIACSTVILGLSISKPASAQRFLCNETKQWACNSERCFSPGVLKLIKVNMASNVIEECHQGSCKQYRTLHVDGLLRHILYVRDDETQAYSMVIDKKTLKFAATHVSTIYTFSTVGSCVAD